MQNFIFKIFLLVILIIAIACIKEKTQIYTNQTREIKVSQNKNFIIELESNPTTGYSWFLSADFQNQTNLILEKQEYRAYKVADGIVGSGGKDIFLFKAVGPANVKVVLEYKRPWEIDIEPIEIAEFSVIITGNSRTAKE